MKPLVIYHGGGCTDGFGAAFAAWLKFGDEAEYLPMQYASNYTDTDIPNIQGREVYILDFSFPRPIMEALFRDAARVVWLDHHKTAFEMWCGSWAPKMKFSKTDDCYIVLDDECSGALLAWEYFYPGTEVPMLIQHIDDRDRWQFKLDGSKELHAALNSYRPWTFKMWEMLLRETHTPIGGCTSNLTDFLNRGRDILRTHNQHVQTALKQARSCRVPWGVIQHQPYLLGLAANAPAFLASDLGHELANKSGTFGLVWSMAGDGQIYCSLRSNGDYDVSAIAKAFGGGGHRNAAGFSTDIDTLMSWLK